MDSMIPQATTCGIRFSYPRPRSIAPAWKQALSSPGRERNKVRGHRLKDRTLTLLHKPLTPTLSPGRGRNPPHNTFEGQRGSCLTPGPPITYPLNTPECEKTDPETPLLYPFLSLCVPRKSGDKTRLSPSRSGGVKSNHLKRRPCAKIASFNVAVAQI